MDTSETNIRMCEKAKKIQKEKPPICDRHETCREWFACGNCGKVNTNQGYLYCEECSSYNMIWLPRQDQLQEMVKAHLWELNFKYSQWLYHTDETGCDFHIQHRHLDFTSMEQLWLAFVMKEKYDKIWDGKDWVKPSQNAT